jgi:hypothetical protein
MNLSDKIQDIFDVIEKNNIEFLAKQVGSDFLTKKDKKILKDNGIDLNNLPKDFVVDNIFKFGILAESLSDSRTKDLTLKQFKKFIADRNFIPLNNTEKEALNFVKSRVYNDIKGLGNKMSQRLGGVQIEVDQKKRERIQKIINDKTQEAILFRRDKKWLASELANATKDYLRNFERIANYVLHEAYNRGRIASMFRKSEGEDVKVFFKVHKNACINCKTLYLNSDGSAKIFDLSQILSNGNNIGLKVKDWKATASPVHPNCRCEIFQHRTITAKQPESTQKKTKRNVLRERGVSVKVKIG